MDHMYMFGSVLGAAVECKVWGGEGWGGVGGVDTNTIEIATTVQ